MRLHRQDHHETERPLRFPVELAREKSPRSGQQLTAEDALKAIDNVSRRIDDLARELNCLGWFDDDDDDRPRAA